MVCFYSTKSHVFIVFEKLHVPPLSHFGYTSQLKIRTENVVGTHS